MKKIKVVGAIIFFSLVCIVAFGVYARNVTKVEKMVYNHRLQWWLEKINWDEDRLEYSGKGIKIALIDSGVNKNHPDLNDCIIDEIKIDNLEKSSSSDDLNHGTAVAGIIAAKPSHEKGVLGVAVDASILSIDVTNEDFVEVDNLITGIERAIENNVDIINISLGVKTDNEDLYECIKKAYDMGIVIVASAGNYMDGDVLYPAKYECVLCVGSLSKKGEVISPLGDIDKTVIFLPGENIVTTSKDDYFGVSGTSFSTPILAGIIALMMEANPEISNKEIYEYFNESTSNEVLDAKRCIKDIIY